LLRQLSDVVRDLRYGVVLVLDVVEQYARVVAAYEADCAYVSFISDFEQPNAQRMAEHFRLRLLKFHSASG
jgi:hypothetical protein